MTQSLAVLSDRPHLLSDYFKQLFAQVTNPPVDCIREECVMSMDTTVGREHNLLDASPEACQQIKLSSPVLGNAEMDKLRRIESMSDGRFKSITIPILYKIAEGSDGLRRALADVCERATAAIGEGHELLILSDRAMDRDNAAIPAPLAVSGVHHHLLRLGLRTHVGLILESGEPREVHHFALLVGYGCAAINPYLAFETIEDLCGRASLERPRRCRRSRTM